MVAFAKEEIMQGISDYFQSEQWKTAFEMIKDPAIDHIHVFVDSCLNPYTIDEVFVHYLTKQGHHFSRKPYHGAIQDIKLSSNIEADDLPPFEIFSYYNSDLVLSPKPGREEIEYWTAKDVEAFWSQFAYTDVKPEEEQEVRDYFTSSEHWRKAMEMVVDPDMEHLHINIETRVHPKVLAGYMREAFENQSWILNKIEHMIFSPSRLPKDQKQYYGKIMVMLKKPDITRFDVAYIFNPDVLIRPSTKFISYLEGVPEFDIGGTHQMVERYISLHDFVTLAPEDIQRLF